MDKAHQVTDVDVVANVAEKSVIILIHGNNIGTAACQVNGLRERKEKISAEFGAARRVARALIVDAPRNSNRFKGIAFLFYVVVVLT